MRGADVQPRRTSVGFRRAEISSGDAVSAFVADA